MNNLIKSRLSNSFTIAAFLVSVVSSQCFAGNDSGNGGGAVVCRSKDAKITSIEILDFYEARTLRSIKIDLGADKLSVADKIKIAVDRLRIVSPIYAERYLSEALKFTDDSSSVFLKGVELTFSEDTAHIVRPKNCSIEQVVSQRPIRFPEDRHYTVNLDLWSALDSTQKAGLILHEVVYRHALEQGHKTSLDTRYFVSKISSASGLSAIKTPEQLLSLYLLINFKTADLFGTEILARSKQGEACSVKFDSAGKLLSFIDSNKLKLFYQGQVLTRLNQLAAWQDQSCSGASTARMVEGVPNGRIESLTPGKFVLEGKTFECPASASSPWSVGLINKLEIKNCKQEELTK